MSQQLRKAALTAYSVATILGLAACSSAPHSPAAAAGSSTPAPASASAAGTPATAPAATAGLPDGTKLNAMLLAAGAIPGQLKLDPSGTRSTGNGLNPPASSAPVSKPCDALSSTGWINTAGVGSASFAQNDYTDGSQDMFAQELDAFQGTDAQTAMAHLKQVFAGCATFKADQNGQTFDAKVSVASLPGVGDEAVKAVITSPDWTGGTTLVAARVGKIMVTTLYNDQSTTGTAGVALTKTLANNVKTAG